MTEESMPLVPSFSGHVDASAGGADDAAQRLDVFAAEHRIGADVRDRLAAVTRKVITTLAGGDSGSDSVMVEADIDQGNLQVVFLRELGSAESVNETRTRLAGICDSCDGFSTQRADTTNVEVWVCFSLA